MKTKFLKGIIFATVLVFTCAGCGHDGRQASGETSTTSTTTGSTSATYQVNIAAGSDVVAKDASTGEAIDIIGGAVEGESIKLQK